MSFDLLQPISAQQVPGHKTWGPAQVGSLTRFEFQPEDLRPGQWALLSCGKGGDFLPVRTALYGLFTGQNWQLTDLGNWPDTQQGSYTLLLEMLLDKGINLILLNNDLSWDKPVHEEANLAMVYPEVPGEWPESWDNISLLGYQSYLSNPDWLREWEERGADLLRLGMLREDFQEAEPLLRESHHLFFDLASIRTPDRGAGQPVLPHGLFGEEGCRLMRFAGISDSVQRLTLRGLDHRMTPLAASLAAQLLWHFLDGLANRTGEHPSNGKEGFLRFTVAMPNEEYELVFLKSKRTNRWWMEHTDAAGRAAFAPCSYSDYQRACRAELPDRWLKALKVQG